MNVLDPILAVLAAVLMIGGAVWVLVSAVAMFRVGDALSRINVFSPATGLGLPMLVAGVFVEFVRVDGFDPVRLLNTLLSIVALIAVASVASNVLARSAYMSGTPVDPRTSPQDLAEEPPAEAPAGDWADAPSGQEQA
ncbi:monovalent cation/H(+) antiporter subunit G [Brachybacterium sp. EF45031]|uniref:cation:proton antiporter n=1 Tax=Brachybacterium sillae TaxID=2810536 RepID=UPI00217F18E7|nr:monovalent cation/H(+) antiporter subunit G [Brachybacterium sillae]MCS6711948.1 monovalent cation/H(+) antiporter subunit G [Brachybacterium sillae]